MKQLLTIELPAEPALDCRLGKHRVRQLAARERVVEVAPVVSRNRREMVSLQIETPGGKTWIVSSATHAPKDAPRVLLVNRVLSDTEDHLARSDLRWKRPAPVKDFSLSELSAQRSAIAAEWEGQFGFQVADSTRLGLRPPQAGALHALLAHWTVSEEVATIVMPTGTGKTETMIAAFVSERLVPLLVVVPSRILRTQLAEKFLRLGVLPDSGVVPEGVSLPIVCTLEGSIGDLNEAQELLQGCHVLVATMQGLSHSSEEIRVELANQASCLFIDEAHHVGARTWNEFRDRFSARRVVQFTATPFRADNKIVAQNVTYRYPLRKAQQEGYFRRINFKPVTEFVSGNIDRAIAKAALTQLEDDLGAGLDHVLLARAKSIPRAGAIQEVYRALTSRQSVLVHSGLSEAVQAERLDRVKSREARIVVCVDMLGEGYDLPALKIAALHDMHRGLGITLQFIGRFTRDASSIGDATVVANTADPKVEESIEELYSQDADWDALIQALNEGAVGQQLRRAEFLSGFVEPPADLPLQNIFPKMSTVAYRVSTEQWHPDNASEVIPEDALLLSATNQAKNVTVLVTQNREPISWGDIASLQNLLFDLYLLYWDQDLGLLFIHSSDTHRPHRELARAVCGDQVELVQGMEVFRALSGINRLVIANLGLRHAWGRSVRYTMYAGINVNEGLSEANFANKTTSNLFGFGFEEGDRASVGCSYKGRLWSYRVGDDIGEWVEWCRHVGRKLTDVSVDPLTLLRTTMTMEVIKEIPTELTPLGIEWSENVWTRNEETLEFRFDDEKTSLLDVGIALVARGTPPLRFSVFSETSEAQFELELREDGAHYTQRSGPNVSLRVGQRAVQLTQWFVDEPPIIRFHNGQQLVGELLLSAPTTVPPFDAQRIEVWDWEDTDLSRESQGPERDETSIQYQVIQRLLGEDLDLILNDDGTNEAADVVTIKVDDEAERLRVGLYHCKYSTGTTPGHRVEDLYEVCGQAQKSVHWKGDRERLFDHLARRDALWVARGLTRFEKGDQAALAEIGRRQRFLIPEFEIFVVQPGLSKAELTDSQRSVLGATALYLSETFSVGLRVIASA
jgi:superfamily II DNA or RNA helicase